MRARSSPGVEVSMQAVPGFAVRAVRVRAVIDAPVETVLAVLRRQDRSAEWTPNTKDSKILARPSRSELIAYSRTVSPSFLVSDRDAVLRSRLRVSPSLGRIEILSEDAQHPAAPARRGVVRIPDMEVRTVLEKIGPNKTRITQALVLDPGGSIPAFIVNAFADRAPSELIANLARQVKRPDYAATVAELKAEWPELAAMKTVS